VNKSRFVSCSMVSSSDVRRLFLQAALSRRILSENLAKILWDKCKDAVKGTSILLSEELRKR
jgi:hypothetical protein